MAGNAHLDQRTVWAANIGSWTQHQRLGDFANIVDGRDHNVLCAWDLTPQHLPHHPHGARSAWTDVQLVDELNSSSLDGSTWLSFDDRTMYLSSQRPPSIGLDIWRSERASPTSPFGMPTRIEELAGTGEQSGALVSPDGLELLVGTEALTGNEKFTTSGFVLAHPRWAGTAWVELAEFAPTMSDGESSTANWSRDGLVIAFLLSRSGGLGGDNF